MGLDSLFNKWYWENWTGTWREMKLGHQLTLHIRINLKWIKYFNINHDIIKILEESIGSKISVILCSNIITDISPIAEDTKDKIYQIKMRLHEIKKLLQR